jgi:hypothetical protein
MRMRNPHERKSHHSGEVVYCGMRLDVPAHRHKSKALHEQHYKILPAYEC